MPSPETTEHLLKLQGNQGSYIPNPEHMSSLGGTVLVIFTSPSGEGKTTIMEHTAATDSRFDIVGNRTSRPARLDDNPARYIHYPHTDDGLQPMFTAIDKGEYAQYAVSPYEPYYLYGTDVADYRAPYCMKDVFFDAIPPLRRLPFRHLVVCNIVTEPDIFIPRFNARFPDGHPNRPGRIGHDMQSMRWSLEQPDSEDHVWIENGPDLDETVAEVLRVAEGGYVPDSRRSRAIGFATLRALRELQA